MVKNLIALVAGFTIALGGLMITVGVHDEGLPEDSTVVWVCHVSGGGTCGPDVPPVMIAPDNLFRGW